LVDKKTKIVLDNLESVHKGLYSCIQIEVKDDEEKVIIVWAYLLENFKEDLLNDETILLSSYSNSNSLFPPYIKNMDRSEEGYQKLLSQVMK
jgi:hypothetical protein